MEKYFLCASACILMLADRSQIVSTEKIFIHPPAGRLEHPQKYSHYGQKIQSSQTLHSPPGQILQVAPEFPVWKIHKYSGVQINPVKTIPYVRVPEIKPQEKPRFEAPPLDHIQSLLGTSSESETIDTLRELASTEDGLKLMANYIKAEYPESEISVKDIASMISQYKINTPEVESKWIQPTVQKTSVYQEYDQPVETHKSPLSEKYGVPSKRNGPTEQFSNRYSLISPPSKKYGLPIPQPNSPPFSHKFDSKSLTPNLESPHPPNKHKSYLPPFLFPKPPSFLKDSSPPLVTDQPPYVFPTPPQKLDSHLPPFPTPALTNQYSPQLPPLVYPNLPSDKYNPPLPHLVLTNPPSSDKYNPHLPPFVFPKLPPSNKYNTQLPLLVSSNPSPVEKYNSNLPPSILPLTSSPPQKYGPPTTPLFPNDPSQPFKVCLTSQNINQQPPFIFTTLPLTIPLPQKYYSHVPHITSPSQKYGPPIPSINLSPPAKYNLPHPSPFVPTISLTSPPSEKYGSPPPVYGIPIINDSSSFLVKAKPIVVLESQNTNYNNEKSELLEENPGNTFQVKSTYGPPSIKEAQDNKFKPEENGDNIQVEKFIESYGPPKSSSTEVDSNSKLNLEEENNSKDTEETIETEELKQTYVPPTNTYGAPKPNAPINYVAESEGDDISALSENTSDSSADTLSSIGSQTQIPNQQYGLPGIETTIVEPFTEYGNPIENKIKSHSYPGYEPTPVNFFEAQKINSDVSSAKDASRVIPFSISQKGIKLHDFEQGIHILNEENNSIKPDKIIANMWNGAPELLLPSAMSGTHQFQQSSFIPTYEPNKFMLAVEQNYVKPLSSSEVKITQEEINKDGRDVTALKFEHPSFSYTQFSKKPTDTNSHPPHYAKISDLPLDNGVHFKNIPGQTSSYGEPILSYIFSDSLPAASEKKTTVVKAEKEDKPDIKLTKESKPKEEFGVVHDEKSMEIKNKNKLLKRKWMPKSKRKEDGLKTTIVYAESANENNKKNV